MLIPDSVLQLLKPLVCSFESCRLESYLDGNNVPTIGWGHTGKDVYYPGQVCSQEQADDWLQSDLSSHYSQLLLVSSSVALQSPSRQAALTDFVYNDGIGNYRSSLLRSAVDVQAWQNVKAQIARWNHVAGKVSPGLDRRRKAEIALIDA